MKSKVIHETDLLGFTLKVDSGVHNRMKELSSKRCILLHNLYRLAIEEWLDRQPLAPAPEMEIVDTGRIHNGWKP